MDESDCSFLSVSFPETETAEEVSEAESASILVADGDLYEDSMDLQGLIFSSLSEATAITKTKP